MIHYMVYPNGEDNIGLPVQCDDVKIIDGWALFVEYTDSSKFNWVVITGIPSNGYYFYFIDKETYTNLMEEK